MRGEIGKFTTRKAAPINKAFMWTSALVKTIAKK